MVKKKDGKVVYTNVAVDPKIFDNDELINDTKAVNTTGGCASGSNTSVKMNETDELILAFAKRYNLTFEEAKKRYDNAADETSALPYIDFIKLLTTPLKNQ